MTATVKKLHPGDAPDGMTAEEWQTRCDLAAAYRLAALYGWTDLAGTHFSARIPGPEDHFLLNPFGMLFGQITASSLIKVDCDGNMIGESDYPFNPAGFVIHSAIHMNRPELTAVLHTHTRAGAGVSSQKHGLLPINQKQLTLMGFLGYHDYEGAALNEDERTRIVRDLGDDGRCMILRNHGLMTVGESIAEAWVWMYRLEAACQFQIDAQAAGGEFYELSEETKQYTIDQGKRLFTSGGIAPCGFEWPSLLRQLDDAGEVYRV